MSTRPNIEIYTSRWCGYCSRAKRLLDSKNTTYTEIDVDSDPRQRVEMQRRSGRTSVPQIWIDNQHIGGCDELYALDARGKLDALLVGDGA